jgi:hypothetical protein
MSATTESSSGKPSSASSGWTTLALLVGWAACVLVLVYLLELRPRLGADTPTVETVSTTQAGFPAPERGAVVFARAFGSDALAVGFRPTDDGVAARVSVIGPDGAGASGLNIAFRAGGQRVAAEPCGSGCYRATLATNVPPRTVVVDVDGDSTTRWTIRLPRSWPTKEAAAIMTRAGRTWRSLRSLSFDETLSSGPGRVVRSSWRIQAPDRLAYRILGGGTAVVIGKRRWDRDLGGSWRESSQQPLRQPRPPWAGVTNAHVVDTIPTPTGRAVVVTFFDPWTPGWFEARVDSRTHRILDLRMVATAHFMHDHLHSLNTTPPIRPPSTDRAKTSP